MTLIRALLLCLLSLSYPLLAQPKGKIDAGPTYLNVGVYLNGTKVKTSHFYGGSATGTLLPFYGLCCDTQLLDGIVLKPRLLVAGGDGDIWNTGLGIGYYIPLGDFSLIPQFGASKGGLRTSAPDVILGPDVTQHSKSWSSFVGLDLSYTYCDWMFSVSYQYAWSHTRTSYDVLPGLAFNEKADGSNVAVQVDYFFNPCWSINAAAAYNESLSKENHGLKIYGFRLGLGYTF